MWGGKEGALTDDLLADGQAVGRDWAGGAGGGELGGGFEDGGVPENVADVDPRDGVVVDRVRLAGLEVSDPPVGVHLHRVVELEAVDDEGDLGQCFDVHGLGHFGSTAVDNIHDYADGLGVELLGQLEMDSAI